MPITASGVAGMGQDNFARRNKPQRRMMSLILLLLCIPVLFAGHAHAATITDYRPTFIPLFTKNGDLKIAIRHFQKDNHTFFLSVDPYSYTTAVTPANALYPRNPQHRATEKPGYFRWDKIKDTPYMKSLARYDHTAGEIQNAGLTHAAKPVQGYFLTVDMCPSTKPFEREFYQQLVVRSDKSHQPFPVAIAVSGLWLLQHPAEFHWLLDQQQAQKLAITWVNHSLSHLYFADLPLDENFLLFPFTFIDDEILAPEIALLQADQVPSIFFRFPGLVADEHLLQTLKKYGLIALGADAWLAKAQKPVPGSIVLVHGNSNEHAGITAVMPYLHDANQHWLALRDALADG